MPKAKAVSEKSQMLPRFRDGSGLKSMAALIFLPIHHAKINSLLSPRDSVLSSFFGGKILDFR
jgi:hypothetical protein